jgi:hypothetical protein
MTGWIVRQVPHRHNRRPLPAPQGLAAALRRLVTRWRMKWAAMAAAARAGRCRAR